MVSYSVIMCSQGVNLTIGCAQNDYAVFLDDTECTVVVLFYDRLQFFAPNDAPEPVDADDSGCAQDKLTHVYRIRVCSQLMLLRCVLGDSV